MYMMTSNGTTTVSCPLIGQTDLTRYSYSLHCQQRVPILFYCNDLQQSDKQQ